MEFPMLLSPIRIGTMELPNRFVVPAMETEHANHDGTISEQLVEYWVARAKGGWALLTVELSAVDPLGRSVMAEIGLYDDKFIPGLKRLADAVHRYGAKIVVQLHHGGRQAVSIFAGGQPVAPSPVPCPMVKEMPRELSTEEVWVLAEKFGDAAVRVREAGFDGVEVHGAHGYLVAQFLSASANKRTDIFGGSLTNRLRFATEVVKNIRRKVGDDYPIVFRLSADEKVPGGLTVNETKVIARTIQAAGVDAISVSAGTHASLSYVIPPAAVPPGWNLSNAAAIRQSVSVPVIAVGRITDPLLAEHALVTGMADLIAFGRQSLAEPELPNKVAAGRLDEIAPCTTCMQGCLAREAQPTVHCLVNPFTGRESELKVEPAAKKKRVVVVGGGPAGLVAAWLAASRGHEVTLYEKDRTVGGQFRIAVVPPLKQGFAGAIAYWRRMGQKHGVHFKLQTEATAELILDEHPDAVVLATGAKPTRPNIKGIGGAKVVDAWDVLGGRPVREEASVSAEEIRASSDVIIGHAREIGGKVLIVGGGMIGCETADFLGERGQQVTIVARHDVANDVYYLTRQFLLERLRGYGVRIETFAAVEEFLEDGVVARRDGQELRLTGFETIVLALGATPVNGLHEALEGKVPEVHVIGDAAGVQKAIQAVEAGARVALKL